MADFRDGQLEAIRSVCSQSSRMLVVHKTGWGKSFVYFIACKLLREAAIPSLTK
jgi:ATP-dependent DNA helicase RecQ